MENNTYRCSWTRTAEGFELWLKDHPRVRGRGRTYEEAEEALLFAIADRLGVQHSGLEFVPPLVPSDADREFTNPELMVIWGDEHFEADAPSRRAFDPPEERERQAAWFDAFYEVPCCRACGWPQGPRNDRPIPLRYVRGEFDAGVVEFAGATLQVVSEKFLQLLTDEERTRLELRPVQRSGKARKAFFELLGRAGPPKVAVEGLNLSGWRCATCRRQVFGHYRNEIELRDFVAAPDLPHPLPHVFTIGDLNELQLCVTPERWARMVEQPGTRGMLSRRIGVARQEKVIRNPELESRHGDALKEKQDMAQRLIARIEANRRPPAGS